MTRTTVRLTALATALVGLLSWGIAPAQVKQGKTRKAATKYLMRGINAAHCGGLAELLKEGPKNDEQWDTAACHASCLNEMSYVLMDDGRCPDADWANAAKTLREGSEAVLAAAQAKDLDAARAGFENVTKACGACHKAHKK
jgi:cytochrome c556